jgi:putative phosphoesterase
LTTIAILADIHGNLPALHAVVDDLRHRGVETVVNLGDHASGPLWPRETLDFLMGQPWVQIAGNHDRLLVHQHPDEHNASDRYAFARISSAQKEWLRALPATIRLDGDILLCHGTPTDDSTYLLETVAHGGVRLARPSEIVGRLAGITAPLVLCGHTHIPRVVQVSDSLLVVNPGSVGAPGYKDVEPEPHVVEIGSPHARYALLERQTNEWHVELVAVAYDHLGAARQAGRNGRPEWESALRTGYLQEERA